MSALPRRGMRSVILNFTPSWFAVKMGTGIVPILLHTAPHQFHGQLIVSTVMYIINIVIFVLSLALTIARYTLYPWVWMLMLRNSTQSLFLGTFPVGLATIVNAIVLIRSARVRPVGHGPCLVTVVSGRCFERGLLLRHSHGHVPPARAQLGADDSGVVVAHRPLRLWPRPQAGCCCRQC